MPARRRRPPAPRGRAGGLAEYEARRDFRRTPEPPPAPPEPSADGPLTFVVQQHRATRMHWDLRLEAGGAMPSWPVPRGPSLDPRERRLAIRTEDHPIGYAAFEGLIPEGQYGAGEVIVWDNGTYSPDEGGALSFHDRAAAEARVLGGIAGGKLSVTLRGRKLKGSWALVRTGAEERGWLLIKHRDAAADPARDLIAEDRSVSSGLTIADLQAGRLPDPGREAAPAALAALPGAVRGDPPETIAPMLAGLARGPFDGADWLFEPKLDGIRAIAVVEGGAARLRSRRGTDLTAQYPALARALAAQPVARAVFDGEIVAPGEHGAPSFERLQRRMNLQDAGEAARADASVPVLFFPFDLLGVDGFDLRRTPLALRLEALTRVLLPGPLIQPVQTFEADGIAAWEAATGLGFEGLVAKRRDSPYLGGRRSRRWLKVKARPTGDFVVGGWREGEGARRATFGALLLGVPGADGALRYAGRVGGGFGDRALRELRARLDALASDRSPFAAAPPEDGRLRFVRPELVAEVGFARWTHDGRLREPVFLRLRDDKPAASVRREIPAGPPPAPAASGADRGAAAAPADGGGGLAAEVAAALDQIGGGARRLRFGDGAELPVTNLDKVLWPETADQRALTKRDLLRYLAAASPLLLPHLRDRPLTLARYPDGIGGGSFYQKHYDRPPPFVETVAVYVDSAARDQRTILCNNLPTLLWLGQIACLELHVSLARIAAEPDGGHLGADFSGPKERVEASRLNYPDFLLFDLDPYLYAGDEPAGAEPAPNRRAFARTVRVARRLRELLDAASLSSYVKTSGATGLHVCVPIARRLDYAAVRSVAATFGGFLERAHPGDVTLEWSVGKRTGKVFVDVNQNARIKSIAAAFSPRPRPGAPVSMPLRWDELDGVYPADFTLLTAPGRLAAAGDPWAGVLGRKHDLAAQLAPP